MEVERAVRIALVRLYAIRHERPVPLADVSRALVEHDLGPLDVAAVLHRLAREHLALETPQGWRPAARPITSRAREPMAQFSWLHA